MSWSGQGGFERRGYHHGNLREALVEAALTLIAEKGPAGFTIAEAARLAGVSPGAPYRHFRDAEALLAEVALRGFERFAAALAADWNGGRPNALRAFEALGRAYLAFARDEPAYYAAMFEARIAFDRHPGLLAAGDRAFAILREAAGASDRGPAAGTTPAFPDGGTSCLGAVTRDRVAVRARRPVAAEAADVARGPAGGGRAGLPAEPRPCRRAGGVGRLRVRGGSDVDADDEAGAAPDFGFDRRDATHAPAQRSRRHRDSEVGIAGPIAPNIGRPHRPSPRKPGQEHEHEVRNHFPRLLAGILLAAGLCALEELPANADDLATIKQRGTLIVGVKADYPPFGFRSPSGEIVGIEPALAADVAKSLGVKLQLVPVVASNRIQLLQQGKIDLIIATMNDTMMRRGEVEIVKPYYYAAGYNIMVPKSMNLKSWAELKGKPVCGIEGAYYNYEAAMNFELQVTAFDGPADALTALNRDVVWGCCMTTPRSRATCWSRSGAITTCRSSRRKCSPGVLPCERVSRNGPPTCPPWSRSGRRTARSWTSKPSTISSIRSSPRMRTGRRPRLPAISF